MPRIIIKHNERTVNARSANSRKGFKVTNLKRENETGGEKLLYHVLKT